MGAQNDNFFESTNPIGYKERNGKEKKKDQKEREMSEAMERAREKVELEKGRREKSLIGRLVGRAPEDTSMDHSRILPDVNLESRRGPTTDGLNDGEINTSFSERSRTARPY